MRIRLRQIVMVAADLDPVETQIVESLGVELCYRDPGVGHFGLRNALFPIGDKLLEVVSPIQDIHEDRWGFSFWRFRVVK